MDQEPNEVSPPSTDLEGWRQAVSDGCFRAFRMEEIVAAIQDLGPKTSKTVLNPLVLHVSDTMIRMLRRMIGRNHRDEGNPMIDRVRDTLLDALFKPESADGKGMRVAFGYRVKMRAVDAIRAEAKHEKREMISAADEEDESNTPAAEFDPWKEVNEGIDVERILAFVEDPLKRLAFRLHMEQVPVESPDGPSIVKAVGKSRKTVEKWIKQVRKLLADKLGEQS